jgi:hypothetical protein
MLTLMTRCVHSGSMCSILAKAFLLLEQDAETHAERMARIRKTVTADKSPTQQTTQKTRRRGAKKKLRQAKQ